MRASMTRYGRPLIDELYARTRTGGGGLIVPSDAVSVLSFPNVVANGVFDDQPGVQNAVNLTAGTGLRLWFPARHPGTALATNYFFATKNVVLPARSRLWGYGARITTQVGGGNVLDNTIFTTEDNSFEPSGSVVSLFADVVPGATTIQVTSLNGAPQPATIVRGSTIAVRSLSGLTGAQYTVQAVTGGAAPFTITLDRAVLLSYPSASSQVEILKGRTDGIEIRGFTFTGVAQQYIELSNTWEALVADVVFDSSGGSLAGGVGFLMTSDGWSYRTTFQNIRGDGGGTATAGLGVEQTEGALLSKCIIENCTNSGVDLFAAADCSLVEVSCSNTGTFGIFIGGNGGNGCKGINIVGGTHSAVAIGVSASFNSQAVTVEGVTVVAAGTDAFAADAIGGFGPTTDVAFIGCTSLGAGVRGFHVIGGTVGTVQRISFDGCKAIGSGAAGFQLDGSAGPVADCQFANCIAEGTPGGPGLSLTTGVTGTLIANYTGGNNASGELVAFSGVTVNGLRSPGGSALGGVPIVELLGGVNHLRGISIAVTATSGSGLGIYANVVRLDVDGYDINYAHDPGGFPVGIDFDVFTKGAVSNMTLTNPAAVVGLIGILGGAAATGRIGLNVDVDAAATPIDLTGGSNRSVGGVSLAIGANTISFSDVRAQERLLITPRAATALTVSAPIPGTGFTVTSTAAVTADYVIE